MASGTARREVTQDSLAGKDNVEPVQLRGGGVSSPRGFNIPEMSTQNRIAEQLSQWSGGKLQLAAEKRQQKEILDGQMAYQQGQTLDQVEMGGNKWALEGYRLMDAQTLSSGLLAAQRQEIAQNSHELDPDAYRERYVNRLDALLEGKDPRTADLVREQMVQQMPTLVADHTVAHMSFLEGKNYDSLVRGVEIISRDPTAHEELVMFAQGGEDSPSAGLSDARRKSAVVSGVVAAFENDNPVAYAVLAKKGLLGDNLTPAQQNQIKAAQERFDSRRRSEYNEELMDGTNELMAGIAAGMDPSEAVENLSILYAEHGIKMTAADARSIYDDAEQTGRIIDKTTSVNVENARLRGDYDTVARLTQDIILEVESGGNVNAVGPLITSGANAGDRAQSGMQVMPKTLRDPGYGVTPAQNDTPEEYMRVGRDYWAAMVRLHKGDIEAAAVAYNAGHGNALKWIDAGRDYSVLPDQKQTQGYTKKVMAKLDNWRAPTPSDKLNMAQARLADIRERTALNTYEQVQPRLADLDDQFKRGEITMGDWRTRRAEVYREYDAARTTADVDHEIGTVRAVNKQIEDQAKTAQDERYRLNLETANAVLTPSRLAWEEVISNPESTPDQIREANMGYIADRNAIFDAHGIMTVDRGNGAETTRIVEETQSAIKAHNQWREDGVEIDTAFANGYISDLSPKLRDRAFKENEARIIKQAQDAAATGEITPEQAQRWMSDQLNASFAQAGVVDPKVSRLMSAAMRGALVDREGNPNPNIVDVVEQYSRIKSMNPSAAKTFFTGEAERIQAEAILSRAENPNLIAEATRTLGLEQKDSPFRRDTQEFLSDPVVQAETSRVVQEFMDTEDISWLHALWQGDANMDQSWDRSSQDKQAIWQGDTRERLTAEVEVELSRMQKITPHIKPKELVRMAAEKVGARSAIVGGDLIMLGGGTDINRTFFGDRAGDFTHDGAVNSAVMEWLRSDEALEQYPDISEILPAERLPGIIQDGLDLAVGLIPFTDLNFEPAMDRNGAVATGQTGIRPYRAQPTPDGKGIFIQYLRPNGSYSDEIVIPARRAGEMYMQRRRSEITQ